MADVAIVWLRPGTVLVVPARVGSVDDVQNVTRLVRSPVAVVIVVRLKRFPAIERRVHFTVISIIVGKH